jgi:LmbE family N-acetylglucosaminyl deacetylase
MPRVAAWQHIAATRKQGQRRAGAILGLSNVIFLDYPDGQLLPTLELRRDLVRLLRRYRTALMICPAPDRTWSSVYSLNRYHPDHLAAGQAALGVFRSYWPRGCCHIRSARSIS